MQIRVRVYEPPEDLMLWMDNPENYILHDSTHNVSETVAWQIVQKTGLQRQFMKIDTIPDGI